MIIGVPKEIKKNENRVALTPGGVQTLKNHGHKVVVQASAGFGSGFSDEEYVAQGAIILGTAEEVFQQADLIVKVKEPQQAEYNLMKKNQVLFTYLHLAPEPELTKVLLEKSITGIAYETVQLPDGSLPLLAPMSEVAGRMSIQIGAHLLEKINNGRGILLGGIPGVESGKVLIIGAGNVGIQAAKMAIGIGAKVTVMDVSIKRLAYIDDIFQGRVTTLMSTPAAIAHEVKDTDLLIGGVLIAGAKAPKLVTEAMVKTMRPGSVIVDVAIDQGGCVETVDHVTSHENPYFVKYGVVHYSVPNIPGAVPRTSTLGLTNVTLPYLVKLADLGVETALSQDLALRKGLNTYRGSVTYQAVAEAQGLVFKSFESF